MSDETLQDIFNDTAVDDTTTATNTATETVVNDTSEPKPELPEELVWQDDDTDTPVGDTADPDTADEDDSDGKTEEELQQIEERNKWMKHRLAPVKDKLTKAEQEIERLKTELSQKTQAPKSEASPEQKPTSASASTSNAIDDIVEQDPGVIALLAEFKVLEAKDDVTNGDLMLAASRLNTRREMLAASIKQQIVTERADIARQEEAIVDDVNAKIAAKREIYPKIDLAFKRIDSNTPNLHVDIRRALLMDQTGSKVGDLAPDLINMIGTDKEALGYLIAESKLATKQRRTPVAALEYIGRLKAQLKDAAEAEEHQVAPDIAHPKPKVGFPRKIKAAPVSEPIDYNSYAEKALREHKAPWLE